MTVGSYEGAEFCELVGLCLLHLLTKEFGKQNIGLYRADVLSYFEKISGHDLEKTEIIQNLQKQWIKHSSRM